MTLSNWVSAEFPKTDYDDTLASFAAAKAKMSFLIELKKEQRQRMVRINPSAQPWSNKMLQVGKSHPEIIPSGLNLSEMGKDVALWEQLIDIDQALTSLKQLVDDTLLAVSVDAYSAALVVYHLGNEKGLTGEGLEDLMDELGKRFARKSRKPADTTQTVQK